MKYLFLNLQMFADANTQTTGTSGLSAEMKTFYSKDLIETALPQLVHAQFGEKTSLPPNGGKTIEFRQWSSLDKATTPLTEGVTPSGAPMVVDTITKTLAQYGNYSTVSDVLDMTAIDPVIVEFTSKHADNMAATLDTIVRNELGTCTNVIRPDDIASSSLMDSDDRISLALINKAATILKKNNATKIDGSFVCIIHPSVSMDLTNLQGWIDIQSYSQTTHLFEGEIGKLYGVRFVETTEAEIFMNVPDDSDDDPIAIYSCVFLAQGAYKVIDIESSGAGIIVKPAGSGGTSDPLDQRSTIGWKAPLYGAKIAIPEYIVRAEVASSFSANDRAN